MKRITTPRRILLAGAVGIAALALAGCGGSDQGMDHDGMGQASGTASKGTFNDADVQFAQQMIPHHQQAVEMAELAETRASDPEIKTLAAQIKDAQDPEIKTMTGWLKAWGQHTGMSGMHGGMPGMMSEDDMGKLEAAEGREFDRMFATMMIAHHKGAIEMAKDEQADGVNPDAKKLAAAIKKTQTAEVEQLQDILDRL